MKAGIESVNVKDDLFTVYFLPFHNFRYKNELQEFISDLTAIHGLINVGYKELARQSKKWGVNTIYNLSKIHSNNELEAIRDKFKDKPAIVVSAGPSMLKSIEAIKKYRDKVIVISVGIALKINFILPPEVSFRLYETNVISRSFNYYTENLFTSDWVQEFTGIDCSPYINRGTVSITALWSAHIMGCNPIILTGQDLAYIDGKCYAGDSHFGLRCVVNQETGEIDFETPEFENQKKYWAQYANNDSSEFLTNALAKFIAEKKQDVTKVKGQNGEWLTTSAGYALFVKHFEELIPDLAEIKLFNSSTGGAQLDGYENIEIEEVLEKFAKEKIDVEKTILEAVNLYKEPSSIDHKIAFINANIEKLDQYNQASRNGSAHIKKFRQQYTRTRKITTDLKQIFFKSIDVYYGAIEKIYSKNRYIMSMSYQEFTEVEDALKEFDTQKTDEALMDLVGKISDFFKIALAYGEGSVNVLKEQKAKISESVTTKS